MAITMKKVLLNETVDIMPLTEKRSTQELLRLSQEDRMLELTRDETKRLKSYIHYHEHAEEISRRTKRRRLANLGEFRRREQTWRDRRGAADYLMRKSYAQTHREHLLEKRREWRKANIQHIRDYNNAWNEKHRQKVKSRGAELARVRRAKRIFEKSLKSLDSKRCIVFGVRMQISDDQLVSRLRDDEAMRTHMKEEYGIKSDTSLEAKIRHYIFIARNSKTTYRNGTLTTIDRLFL